MKKNIEIKRALISVIDYLNLVLGESQREVHLKEDLYNLIDYYEDRVIDGYVLNLYKMKVVEFKDKEDLENLASNFAKKELEIINQTDNTFWIKQREIACSLLDKFLKILSNVEISK